MAVVVVVVLLVELNKPLVLRNPRRNRGGMGEGGIGEGLLPVLFEVPQLELLTALFQAPQLRSSAGSLTPAHLSCSELHSR